MFNFIVAILFLFILATCSQRRRKEDDLTQTPNRSKKNKSDIQLNKQTSRNELSLFILIFIGSIKHKMTSNELHWPLVQGKLEINFNAFSYISLALLPPCLFQHAVALICQIFINYRCDGFIWTRERERKGKKMRAIDKRTSRKIIIVATMNPLERELASFFAIFILQVGASAQATMHADMGRFH